MIASCLSTAIIKFKLLSITQPRSTRGNFAEFPIATARSSALGGTFICYTVYHVKQLVNCVRIQFLFLVDFEAHVYFQPTIHRSWNLVDFLPLSMPFCAAGAKRYGTGKNWLLSVSKADLKDDKSRTNWAFSSSLRNHCFERLQYIGTWFAVQYPMKALNYFLKVYYHITFSLGVSIYP